MNLYDKFLDFDVQELQMRQITKMLVRYNFEKCG